VVQEVTIEPYEKNGEKWGGFFLKILLLFLPTTLYCKIKNPQVVHFLYSKKSNELSAVANRILEEGFENSIAKSNGQESAYGNY
jgi:hypothetical protein